MLYQNVVGFQEIFLPKTILEDQPELLKILRVGNILHILILFLVMTFFTNNLSCLVKILRLLVQLNISVRI
jgi:hypothetical protein